jgi:hypothetical protein
MPIFDKFPYSLRSQGDNPSKNMCTSKIGKSYSSGRRHMPKVAGLKSVTSVGNPDYPALFSQPGLVVANHKDDVTILLQNCPEPNVMSVGGRSIDLSLEEANHRLKVHLHRLFVKS